MPEMMTDEYGVFSPPSPLPNPADLDNGAHGHQLRYGSVNLTTPDGIKKWEQVLAWLKSHGVPTDDYVFFTPQNAGGLGSTQVIFTDAKGRQSAHDATILFNGPEYALTQLIFNFGLPARPGQINFPGFEEIGKQEKDPVGVALPQFNMPGWARPFAQYYSVSPDFDAAAYPIGSRFTRLASDEMWTRTQKIVGWKAKTDNPLAFGSFQPDIQPVWLRER